MKKKHTSKEEQRTRLKALKGTKIFGVGKFTNNFQPRGGQVMRMLLDVKIYPKDGEMFEIDHLWIPMENTKKNELAWCKNLGKYAKFNAKVKVWGLDEKAGLDMDLQSIQQFRVKKVR